MYELTKKLRELTPYEPIMGDYKIRLDANESFVKLDFKCDVPVNRYPDPYVTKPIKAFADYYGINPDNVTAGNGSDELISIISSCCLEKGDKALCFSNDFSMYSFYPYLYELDVEVMDKNVDLTINVDKAINYINENNVKLLMFSNPCNPTSLGLCKEEVKRLINSVNALVVLDEAYMDFWNKNESLLSEINDFDNVIILRTCSKALAMAGIRLGFAVASKRMTTALRAAKSPYNVNVITQVFASSILSQKELVTANIEKVKASIKQLYAEIIALDMAEFEVVYKPVTNFVFIKTSKSREIFDYLLENSIAIRLMGNYLRICAGSEDENAAVIAALKAFR